jgi:hypothetical protein
VSGWLSTLLPEVMTGLDVNKRKVMYALDPALWAWDHLGVFLWSSQRDIAASLVKNRNTAVAAAHGVGKSYSVAVYMAWWVDTHPVEDVFVASTAPFADQITTILWRELRNLHKTSAERYARYLKLKEGGLDTEGLPDHRLPGYITGDNKWKMDDGRVIGQGRKPPDNKEDSGYQGVHAKYLLAVGDEAAGLSQGMIEALGNITTGEYCRRLCIMNPTDPTSYMAKVFRDDNGTWNLMHISAFDSPNFTGEEVPESVAENLVNKEYEEDKRRDFGVDDPVYISRVLGQWAFDEGNNVFNDMEIANGVNAYVLPDPDGIIEFGCDIARMGKDATVIYTYREGAVWERDNETNEPVRPTSIRGGQLRLLDTWRKAPLVGDDPANLGSAQRIHALALAEGAKIVKVDASGLGSAVVDGLAMLNKGQYIVVEIFGQATSPDPRAFANDRVAQFFDMKQAFFHGTFDIDVEDTELQDELRMIVYEYADKGARKIESKDSMKKRGAKSPDRADGAWYARKNVKHLTEGPMAGKKPGDVVSYDPFEMAMWNRRGAPI